MKIRIVATGEVRSVPNCDLVDALIASKVWERVVPLPPQPGNAVWSLYDSDKDGLSALSKLAIQASCSICKQKIWGAPMPSQQAINKLVFWHCGKGETAPKEVAEEYCARGGGVSFEAGYPKVQPETGDAANSNWEAKK